jgi:hypothetical protein
MKRTQYLLALALVFAVAAHAHAQTKWITLTAGTGTGKKTISVSGVLTPPADGYAPGKVTVQRYLVAEGGAQVEKPDAQLTPKLNADGKTFNYGPADISVTVGGVQYNVDVQVTFTDAKGKPFPGGPFANHGTAKSSAAQ